MINDIQDDIVQINIEQTAQNTRLDTAEADIVALENADIALDSWLDAIETEQITQNTRLDTAEADIVALENADVAIDGRLDVLESAFPLSLAGGSLTDVTISAPTNGQVLKYNSGTNVWENGTNIAVTEINSAIDFDNTVAKNENDWMCWNNSTSKWEPRNNFLDTLSDVNPSGKLTGDWLEWDGTNWVPVTPTAVFGTSSIDINTTIASIAITPNSGAGTNYNGVNFRLPIFTDSVPSGL